jgi:outer membrane protein
MKKFVVALFIFAATTCFAATKDGITKIGTVNFKYCLDQSKIGKHEQSLFEKIRKEMEQSIEKKEKELNEMAPKFSDEYLDALTPEAEKELKEKFKTLSQELTQQQNQYYHTLNQANFQTVQKLFEMISKVSKEVAKEKELDIILNDESCFFKSEALDYSKEVVAKLDAQFDMEASQPQKDVSQDKKLEKAG